ncbi:MTH938/NDUFAF3 family protein [uncultured Sphingomonas sp.]|uniref:MTH938/NDUFAF3 family protein n=1 Tax=uncultured Sphingomonas sp. TaxID=158754 RepID=UPI0035CB644B
MRIDRDRAEGPVVSGIAGGAFRVDDNLYRALTLTPLRAAMWMPPALDALDLAALAPLMEIDPTPEFILLGTGAALRRPRISLVRAIEACGIGVEAMDSRAAARTWSVLRGEGRWIGAALYPLG